MPRSKASASDNSKKAKAKASSTTGKKSNTRKRGSKPAAYIAAIVIIILIIAVAIFAAGLLNTGSNNSSSASFDAFMKNYNSAPRVNIFVTSYNGTVLSGTVSCATAIIEKLVASRTNHREASTIDLNIINETTCIRSTGLGNSTANYTTTTLQNCLNTSSTEPSIYINYSTNNVTIIKPDYLYISGDSLFLRECGLASEIS